MITNLSELNAKVNVLVDYIVKEACESTTSGNYFVSVDKALEQAEIGFEDFLNYRDLIMREIEARQEVLDLDYNEKDEEFDVNCALDYCPNYEWCDGDEAIFECSYEEWLERPIKPVYQAVGDKSNQQVIVGSITYHDSGEIVEYTDKDRFLAAYASALDSMGPMGCSAKVCANDDLELKYRVYKIITNEFGEEAEPFEQWKASIQDLAVDSMGPDNELNPDELKKLEYVDKMCAEDTEYQRLSKTYEAALQSDNYDAQDYYYAEMGRIRDVYAADYAAENTTPDVYFTVRDGFGDDVGDKCIPTFDEALKKLKVYCAGRGDDAEGAMLGIVCKTEEKTHKCVLVQHVINKYNESVLKPMYDNISWDTLAVPQIELAALKAKQIQFPFDESTQKRIDSLEKMLGVFERDVDVSRDLYVGKWRVHVVAPGAHYGLNNCLIHDDSRSLIEFWDMSVKKGDFPDGQFVSRYYVETLLEDKWGAGPDELMQHGLCLDGDNADVWSISGAEMTKVYEWLRSRPYEPGEHYLECRGDVDAPVWKMERHFSTDAYVPKMAGELLLAEVFTALPFVKDLTVEPIGPYRDGYGFSVSFVCQANKETVQKSLKQSLEGYGNRFNTEEKVVETPKESLDKVIKDCAAQVKEKPGSRGKNKELEK